MVAWRPATLPASDCLAINRIDDKGEPTMNEQNQQTANGTSPVNDLSVTTDEAGEIKGGPKRIFIGGLSVKETPTLLPDLEARDEVKGGPCPTWQCGFNHNETVVSEAEEEAEAQTVALGDLEAINAEAIKGGQWIRDKPIVVLQAGAGDNHE
jgi:hypothetical protein